MTERRSSSPRIRSAEPADAEAMAAIYGPVVESSATSFELTPPSAAEMGRRLEAIRHHNPWLVAEIDGWVVGYAYGSDFRSRPAYRHTKETTVYVDPGAHGQGVGRRLMQAVLDELARGGARVAVAGIVPPNEASVALHEALGFRHVGTFHQVGHKFGRWHDLGFWEKSLTPPEI